MRRFMGRPEDKPEDDWKNDPELPKMADAIRDRLRRIGFLTLLKFHELDEHPVSVCHVAIRFLTEVESQMFWDMLEDLPDREHFEMMEDEDTTHWPKPYPYTVSVPISFMAGVDEYLESNGAAIEEMFLEGADRRQAALDEKKIGDSGNSELPDAIQEQLRQMGFVTRFELRMFKGFETLAGLPPESPFHTTIFFLADHDCKLFVLLLKDLPEKDDFVAAVEEEHEPFTAFVAVPNRHLRPLHEYIFQNGAILNEALRQVTKRIEGDN